MGKYIVIVFLLIIPIQSLLAQTCTELFRKNHPYFSLAKDLQMNILDLAESLSIYPEHKGMASEWSRFVVGRYNVDADIVQISMGDIASLENPALRSYATTVRLKFVELWKDGAADESKTYVTFIFNSGTVDAGSPLAAKVGYLKNKAYFDNTTAQIKITPYISNLGL
jgi:hypothetical protein